MRVYLMLLRFSVAQITLNRIMSKYCLSILYIRSSVECDWISTHEKMEISVITRRTHSLPHTHLLLLHLIFNHLDLVLLDILQLFGILRKAIELGNRT